MVRKRGFSLVELVIVVVIIGVIAAIAVPRISRGAGGAGEAALRGHLQTLRGAIDMYAAEHRGAFPGASGVKNDLISQLTKRTNEAGSFIGGENKPFGPYLRTGAKLGPLPVGPQSGVSDVIMTTTTPIQDAVNETSGGSGWVYNYQTGEIIANTDDLDENGVGYDTY